MELPAIKKNRIKVFVDQQQAKQLPGLIRIFNFNLYKFNNL